jgi:c-di-AMP phosphodiesterase-like protein
MTNEPGNIMAAVYWVDVTEYAEKSEEFAASRLVAAIIMLDNYDELTKNLSEKDKSALLSAVDDKISAWTGTASGILSKIDRDKYLFLFEERHLKGFVDEKFSLLDSVRETIRAGGVQATLSIGIGKDGKTPDEPTISRPWASIWPFPGAVTRP